VGEGNKPLERGGYGSTSQRKRKGGGERGDKVKERERRKRYESRVLE